MTNPITAKDVIEAARELAAAEQCPRDVPWENAWHLHRDKVEALEQGEGEDD